MAQSTITNIPSLGGSVVEATALNNNGMVVGFSRTTADTNQHAFLFNDGITHDLGGDFSAAFGINSAGQICGDSTTSDTHAFLFSLGGNTDLGTLGGNSSTASAINDAGQVAVNLSSFELGGAALFDPRCGLVRLPGLGVGVDTTRANAMNATGQIVGYAQTAGGVEHPVRWDSGAVTDLGLMPGYVEGQALGINDAGVIVGGLSDQNFPFGLRDVVGFIVVNGVMYNLNTLIPPGTGFTINEAARINNAGQILVAMNPPPALGVTRYAVLTPTP